MVETIMVVHGRSVGGKEKRRRRLKSCSKRKCRQSRQIVCIFWSECRRAKPSLSLIRLELGCWIAFQASAWLGPGNIIITN
ncbi:hypothetical protein HanIR_Chr01g0037221 [Helianthus annuus]|nr:hypothetical protein HanIR_Chr01g0037221 [Helianthus annuus]